MTEKQEAFLKTAKAYGLTPEELMKKLEDSARPGSPETDPEDPDGWDNLPFQWKEPNIEGVSSVIDDFVNSIGTAED